MPVVSNKGLTKYSGTFDFKEKKHLLKRTLFGFSRDDFSLFDSLDLDQSLDLLLTNNETITPPINNYQNQKNDPDIPYGQTWINASFNQDIQGPRSNSFRSWIIQQLIIQKPTIVEKLTVFLHNYLPISNNEINNAQHSYRNYLMLRENCLTNFKNIIKKTTKDCAMLIYLNGRKNVKGKPDENFARELQELFTIGKNITPHYTEDDVIEMAKVLTGYGINETNFTYYFDSNKHDTSTKVFSSFYNNKTIIGQSGANGENEFDEALDMIFAKDEVAKRFCRKLYSFFIYYDIDSTIENNIIAPLAQTFKDNNYEIIPVLRQLLSSEHFFDTETYGSMIKSPLDVMIGAIRENEIEIPLSTNDYENLYKIYQDIANINFVLGQDYYNPPSVSGWPAYYQLPLLHENWINTDTIGKRYLALYFLITGVKKNNLSIIFDPIEFTKKFNNPSDVNLLIKDALLLFITIDTSTELKNQLKNILLYGQAQDYYWTDAWNNHINNPTDKTYKKTVNDLLTLFYKFIFEMPEYQLI